MGHKGDANDPFRISDFWNTSGSFAGKTLCLTDGVYTQIDQNVPTDTTIVRIPPGVGGSSATNRLTVRCLNDGGCDLNAQGTNQPIWVPNSNFVTIEGMDAHDSGFSVVSTGSGSSGGNDIIFRRIVAWNANTHQDSSIFGMYYATNTLVEDVAAFGPARSSYLAFGGFDTGNAGRKVRRMWAQYQEDQSCFGPAKGIGWGYHDSAHLTE